MAEFITLSCPSCGASLQITNELDRFACAHCGQEHLVNRGGGLVSLAPVVERLGGIQRGTDKTAAELALGRLAREIQTLEQMVAEAVAGTSLKYPSMQGVLQKVGKISVWSLLFISHEAVDKLLDELSIEELAKVIKSLEGLRLGSGKKMVRHLSSIQNLKEQIRDKQSQAEMNRRIAEG